MSIGDAEPASPAGPRWLYLHGLGSGPDSFKGRAMSAHYAAKGIDLTRLDLRRPSLERLRLSAGMAAVRDALGGERDRAVVFGSSLGGLTACRVAEEDARICALVLLAPAFRFVERLRRRLGEAGWEAWERSGWIEVHDHVHQKEARVDFGFALDAAAIDERSGGFPDVRVPTLIIHGEGDEVVDIELSREWAAGKRHARLVEVDDGHELAASLPVIQREADAFLAGFLVPPAGATW
ncbi:MAG: alpha/beta fold hydrolase [Polyangiaceae bacterium]|nr:alpha/beta fold hydrolase [Polyangiaceae bacterium]